MEILDKKSRDRRNLDSPTLEKLRATIVEHFSKTPFQEVGIRQICETAKVSPKTIYKYFGNKEEMLFACIKQDLDELNSNCLSASNQQEKLENKLSVFIDEWCHFYFENPIIARIVFLNIPQSYWVGERHFIQSEIHDATLELIKQGQQSGVIHTDIPPSLLMNLLMGAAHRAMIHWLLDENANDAAIQEGLKQGLLKLLIKN